jgi:hypothetical protein
MNLNNNFRQQTLQNMAVAVVKQMRVTHQVFVVGYRRRSAIRHVS